MIYHPKSYKAAAWLLALSLTAGGTASAAAVPYDTTSSAAATGAAVTAASATPFSDVAPAHWAEKHISKLASQGIIVGNNGLFRPSDSVTRQEAIVMAIRFAGLEGQLNRKEAVVFPTSFHVDNYFIPYVVLAFEKGLIDQKEQFAIADKEGKDWGSAKASREWVTKLTVKAIGKNAEALALGNQKIPFDDATAVGEGYAGYINEAVSLKLMNGVANNKFDPAGAVTRAMMAKLLSLAEGQYPVNYAGQTEGILTSLKDGKLGLYTSDGEKTYTTSASTVFARFDQEQLSNAANMISYARVSVIIKDGAAQYVELLGTEQQVETINGTFDRIIPSTHKLWIWVNDEPVEIRYDDSLQVVDGQGNVLDVSALTKDATVKITRDKFRSSPIAISVQVASAPQSKTGTGTVQSVGASAITINSNGASETWNVSPDALLLSGNTLLDSLAAVKAGDQISYEVKNDAIVRLVVEVTNSAKVESGIFYSSDKKTITYLKDKKYITKPITDATVINIEGMPTATLEDLQDSDQIELTINASDQITKISVLSRKVELAVGVEIRNYDADYKALNVVDGNGKLRTLYLRANSQIDMNGLAFTIDSAVSSGLLAKGRKITISYTGDTIVKIQLAFKYTGTVVSVDSTNQKLTISMNGTLMTLPLQTPYVEQFGKASSALSDVQSGATITATMNQTQDKVGGIYIHRYLQMKVVSVNTSTNRITVREGNNSAIEINASNAELVDENGVKISLGSLSAGNVVNVSFVGSTLSNLQRVTVSVGAVKSVDASQVALVDYSGRTVNVPLGTGYSIIRNGSSSASYSAVQAGDRVEVRKDTQGKVQVTVLSSVEKKFFKYDSATNTIQTKRANINDTNYKFSLAGVPLTSGGSGISPTSLKDDDSLIFYYYEDKLIEIEKR
ncbi:S-layer homology domain-containing protein [Paenibacillus sp. PR3]|uniref:S-layer homology domain-containing protein n=1 Tax=Paenibacillus terricola TaxID=2763503 RepID=A0ABR8MSF9_9BACL|nr:S-layer homology domain-containing protein [Paenibacillus terricola]MBD3918858.1 S-layer homology domain-containing protein [Paenibacillus terricola]